MKKTSNKLVLVLKEDNQLFGIILEKPTNLKEAILYPITSLTLNIASSNSSLNQADKGGFRSYRKNTFCISRFFHQMRNGSTTVWQTANYCYILRLLERQI